MDIIQSTPWNFADAIPQFFSPNNQHFLRYDTNSLLEVGMGGPLYGRCFWGRPDGGEVLLHETCGGPAVWQTQGKYAALPVWQHSLFGGWKTTIGVVDVDRGELVMYKKRFSVLQLGAFDDQMIMGTISPIYHPQPLQFHLPANAVEQVVRL